MVKSLVARVLRLDEPTVQDASRSKIVIHTQSVGSTGTENYSGYNREEYLASLQGTERADIFDKMVRSDPQVKMCISAVTSPIKSAIWDIEPADQNDPESVADAELVKHILFNDMEKPWDAFIHEALGLLRVGHSVFEIVDKVVLNHPLHGSYNGIKTLAFRSQRTIERWNLDPKTDQLKSVTQIANGDLGRNVDIPAEFLLVFSLDKEGSNYEGISAIRCCYGNWFRKNEYLKLNAIGIEKFAIPTPLAEVPDGKEGTAAYDLLISALEAYVAHEKNYLTFPAGWKISLNTNTYDPSKVETSIDNEDKRMVKAFMANFLELGMNGFGSQSLSFDLSDFFLNSLDHIANLVSSEVNRVLIPRIIQLNRGPRAKYPKLKHSGISDRAGKEIADIIKLMVDSGVMTADDVLEKHLRKRFNLPEQDAATKRAKVPATSSFGLMERIKEMRSRR